MTRADVMGRAAALLLSLGLCTPAGVARNVVPNGDFEDGLKGWESGGVTVQEVRGWTPRGPRVARLAGEATDGGGWLKFTSATEAGMEYRLTLMVNSPDFRNCMLMATMNGTSPYDLVLSHQSKVKGRPAEAPIRRGWKRRSGSFIAPDGKVTIQIGPGRSWGFSKAGVVWIDDVRLTPTGRKASYGQHYEYRAVLPSQAAVGKPVRLIVTGLCVAAGSRYGIPIHLDRKLTVTTDDDNADLPSAVTFTRDKRAVASAEVTFNSPGVHRLTVTDAAGDKAVSNPVRVAATLPKLRHYWGDLHIHTRYQHGSIKAGDEHDNYTYARDVAGLDFAALSEHNARQITPEIWLNKIAAGANRYNKPGRFVTLLGVESGTYQGHHNYYLRSGNPLDLHDRRERRVGTEAVLDFYVATGTRVLCIPHHTALLQPIDWLQADRERRRLLEVYSNHGSSEEPGPWWRAPLYRGSGNRYPDSGALAGHTWRDGLAMGRRIGVIGAGDSHSARPGLTGVACVLAPELKREDIWDGMHARRCYATTGQRILMDFAVNRAVMGSEAFIKAGTELTMRVRANACDAIDRIEVVSDGKVVNVITGRGMDMTATRTLGRFDGKPRYYYLRLTQTNGYRAWTSPVWVLPAGTPDLCVQRKDVSFDHAAGTLEVLARNYGDTAAETAVSVHSAAADGQIARHEF
ncbi:MAG: CehA/McbA family metallohydrolase, partial [Planctomycetota bacterium]